MPCTSDKSKLSHHQFERFIVHWWKEITFSLWLHPAELPRARASSPTRPHASPARGSRCFTSWGPAPSRSTPSWPTSRWPRWTRRPQWIKCVFLDVASLQVTALLLILPRWVSQDVGHAVLQPCFHQVVQFSSLHFRTVIFAFPLTKCERFHRRPQFGQSEQPELSRHLHPDTGFPNIFLPAAFSQTKRVYLLLWTTAYWEKNVYKMCALWEGSVWLSDWQTAAMQRQWMRVNRCHKRSAVCICCQSCSNVQCSHEWRLRRASPVVSQPMVKVPSSLYAAERQKQSWICVHWLQVTYRLRHWKHFGGARLWRLHQKRKHCFLTFFLKWEKCCKITVTHFIF